MKHQQGGGSSYKLQGDQHLQHLEQIAENTRGKVGFQVIVSGDDSRIVTTFEQPIKLDPKRQYELALLNLETYYSFPNINETNNKLRYRVNATSEWQTVEIPVGSYEIRAIGYIISKQAESNITLRPNLNTLKCILYMKGTYEVNFEGKDSIHTVLILVSTVSIS